MRAVVTFEVAAQNGETSNLAALRQQVAARLEAASGTAYFECSGLHDSHRGGYFVGTFDSPDALLAALGSELLTSCRITVQPVVQLHELETFFNGSPSEQRL